MTNESPTIALNSGTHIPQIGFGVFKVDPSQTQRVVEDALEVGYRHIDTATGYDNEKQVGAAIKASGLKRDEVFVTTKLRNDHHKEQDVTGAFSRSLDALGLDYLDLYLIHWPMPANDLYVATWKQFEKFYQSGDAKAIGVSNFLIPHLQRLISESDTVPAVNQIELHPIFQQQEQRAFQLEHDIMTEAWGPLGQGKYDLFGMPVIKRIAKEHEATPAQVVLRWHLQTGNIIIPKTTSRDRMAENLAIVDLELTADDMAAIDLLDQNKRVSGDPAEVN